MKDCHSRIWYLLSKSSSHIYDVINFNFINASEKVFLPVLVKLNYVSVKLSIFPAHSGQNRSNIINYTHIALWEGQEITRKCKFVYSGFIQEFWVKFLVWCPLLLLGKLRVQCNHLYCLSNQWSRDTVKTKKSSYNFLELFLRIKS